MRHSHPSGWRVRFGLLRQPTASHETLRSKDADQNCRGGADELSEGERSCPVSKVLRAEITLDAKLV